MSIVKYFVMSVMAAYVLTATAFAGSLLSSMYMDQPNWACNAEDEVVVIDDTCRHVDEFNAKPRKPRLSDFPLQGRLQQTANPQPADKFEQTQPSRLR